MDGCMNVWLDVCMYGWMDVCVLQLILINVCVCAIYIYTLYKHYQINCNIMQYIYIYMYIYIYCIRKYLQYHINTFNWSGWMLFFKRLDCRRHVARLPHSNDLQSPCVQAALWPLHMPTTTAKPSLSHRIRRGKSEFDGEAPTCLEPRKSCWGPRFKDPNG